MLNIRAPLAVLTTALLVSCGKDADSDLSGYCDPTANAGADVAVPLGGNAGLDASTSEACGGLDLSYTWTFEQVPVDSEIDDGSLGSTNGTADGVTGEFLPDVVGTYVLSLTVNDGVKTSNADLVVVTVTSENGSPTANAGPDQPGEVGIRAVLDGSESSDPEGDELDYRWTLVSSPSGSTLDAMDVFDGTTAAASFVPDISGIYVLSLVVSDGISWSEPDYVSVTTAAENQPPIADAGESQTLSPCDDGEVELNGWGSYDPDGDTLVFQWSLVSAPSGSSATEGDLDDLTKPNPRFDWDVTGSYTFSLQVYDGHTWSASDVVTYAMVDISGNRAPVANAGENQTIASTVDCTSSSYVWSCESCEAVQFEVDGTASSDANGDSLTYYWKQTGAAASGNVDITSPYTAWSEVRAPETAATYGKVTSHSFELTLEAADCTESDTDIVSLIVTCEGVRP